MEKMLAVEPGTQEFDRRAREGNLVPVSCEVIADLETPISAYLRLRDLPHPFLLESVEGGAKAAQVRTGSQSARRTPLPMRWPAFSIG